MSDTDSSKEFFYRRAEYYRNMGREKYENSAGAWLWAAKRIAELEATIAELRDAASWSRDLLWRMQSGQVLDYNKAEIAQVIKAIDATLEKRVKNNALE